MVGRIPAFAGTAWAIAGLMAIPGAGCSKGAAGQDGAPSAARSAGACNETLRQGEEALREAEADYRLELAVASVAESCPGLPQSARSAFEQIAGGSTDDRPLLVARAVADHPDVWMRACAGGISTFAAVGAAAPADKAGILVDGCGLAAAGDLGSSAELRAADGMTLALALLVQRFLLDAGIEAPRALVFARAVLGR